MILECEGIETDRYFLPPFSLEEGEIVVLHLFGGGHFYETEMYLKDVFIGAIKHHNVKIYKPFSFVEHFREPVFRRTFCPVTVEEYLCKKNKQSESFCEKNL